MDTAILQAPNLISLNDGDQVSSTVEGTVGDQPTMPQSRSSQCRVMMVMISSLQDQLWTSFDGTVTLTEGETFTVTTTPVAGPIP